jgi:copper(I)-binding protein
VNRAVAGLAALALVGCGGSSGDALDATIVSDGFAVSEAWTRPSPPGVSEAAIYLSIENREAPDDRFIGSVSDRCVVMHPHLTDIDGAGVASMVTVEGDQLAIPSGGTLDMEPNALHVMCLGLEEPLELGDTFEIELQFSNHDPVSVPVVVTNR